MRTAESFNETAAKFRKLAREANAEIAGHLLDLAEEFERMGRGFVREQVPAPNPWDGNHA